MPGDHASHFILEGLTPWITQVEKDCLSIVREAHAESLRVPTPEQHAAQPLVIYKKPKNDERALVLHKASRSNHHLSTVLRRMLELRQVELEDNSTD